MRVFLIGGGSGGHITPLLAVAHELKKLQPDVELIGVCEKNAAFVRLYQDDPNIDRVFQVRAGKYRRYAGLKWYQRWFDMKTLLLNLRDVGRTAIGYVESKRLLRELKPDVLLIKGGFVAVPLGKAAAKLGIPYLTHDSDSMPGLANRLISKKASLHATGMPADLYAYPADKTLYTGIPVSDKFKKVSPSLRAIYRESVGLSAASHIITLVGGSQGAKQLNEDFVTVTSRLMKEYPRLGIIHIAGAAHAADVQKAYSKALPQEAVRRVVVHGFVPDVAPYQGAADVVISRAGATQTAELALQALPIIVVPGRLAGGHQDKNATYLQQGGAAEVVPFGDSEMMYVQLRKLLESPALRKQLGERLHKLARPDAAKRLAEATLTLVRGS